MSTSQPGDDGQPTVSATPVGHEGTRVNITERAAWQGNGFVGVALIILLLLGAAGLAVGIVNEADKLEPSAG